MARGYGSMKKTLWIGVCSILLFGMTACGKSEQKEDTQTPDKNETTEVATAKDLENGGSTSIEAKPLPYKQEKQMVMKPLDQYKRAVDSHIQVSKDQLPTQKRAARLTVNPSGWHNYKVKNSEGQDYWAYNRGHLVGYQFCGLNDEVRNLITETRSLNAGGTTGTDSDNPLSMLYYEQRLRDYVDSHPNERLDYQVTPLYHDSELMARSVRLSFVAYDHKGREKKINISSPKNFVSYKGNLGQVTLPNVEKGLDINYQTGKATITDEAVGVSNQQTYTHHSSIFPYWLAYSLYDNMRDNIRYRRIRDEYRQYNNRYYHGSTYHTNGQPYRRRTSAKKVEDEPTSSTQTKSSSSYRRTSKVRTRPSKSRKVNAGRTNNMQRRTNQTPRQPYNRSYRTPSMRVKSR